MNKKTPYFSIIIPTLNEEKYVPKLLNDLAKQTNTDFEVLVIDGKSTDKTKAKSLAFQKRLSLRLYESAKRNVCTQRNLGAQKARAFWLLFMDADNRIPTYFIQGLRYQIDKSAPHFFITLIEPDGIHPLDIAIAQVINTFFQTQKSTKNPYLLESMLGIKKVTFTTVGGFNESLVWSEGQELLKRLTQKKYQLTVLKEPKYIYSFRRIKKEGALKALRNSAYLVLAQQTGIKLDNKAYQKYYPMMGGDFFDKTRTPSNLIEIIMTDLLKKHEIPLKLPKDPLKKLTDYFRR